MENTVERLEAMFQKADSEVNNLSQRLKLEFENDEDMQHTNPAELINKIIEVKKEYTSLTQQAAALQETQKEAVGEFRGHIHDICQLLLKLQSNTGTPPSEKPEELCRLEQFLGSEIPWNQKSVSSATCIEEGSSSSQTSCESTDQTTPVKPELLQNSLENIGGSSDEVSPAHKRRTTEEYVEMSREEFESVSELIRGRVKLLEVNHTYRILWDFFKANKDCKPLTSNEMHNMCLRVSGVTGQAKLKVLRALKLVKLSTKGDVMAVF